MNKQIKEALALEQQAQQFLSALKNEIGAAIEATDPMPGVQISGTHPIYAVVNLSALHRHSLAPNVYIPSAQADAVRSKLAPKQTVQGLLEALEDMTENQAACFPNNGTVLLNDKTVGALRQYLHSAVEEDAEHG